MEEEEKQEVQNTRLREIRLLRRNWKQPRHDGEPDRAGRWEGKAGKFNLPSELEAVKSRLSALPMGNKIGTRGSREDEESII